MLAILLLLVGMQALDMSNESIKTLAYRVSKSWFFIRKKPTRKKISKVDNVISMVVDFNAKTLSRLSDTEIYNLVITEAQRYGREFANEAVAFVSSRRSRFRPIPTREEVGRYEPSCPPGPFIPPPDYSTGTIPRGIDAYQEVLLHRASRRGSRVSVVPEQPIRGDELPREVSSPEQIEEYGGVSAERCVEYTRRMEGL